VTTPTKIAFGITELDVGGAEQALTQLVLGLDRSAWEPRVFALGSWGPFATLLNDAGVPVTCFDAGHWWDSIRVLRQWTGALQSWQPQILQTFLFHANVFGRLAARRAGVPVIVSGLRVAERSRWWYGRLDQLTNRLVTCNVCVSRGVADYWERQLGGNPAKTVVIPNGVDLQRFATASPIDWSTLGLPADGPVMICIGRLEPQKGIDDLLRALPSVLERHPEWSVVIVGDGPDRRTLERSATEAGLASRVRFLGRRNDIPQLLSGSSLLVLPSRWEGMPNVVLEAMAAGTPVVVTAVEGIAELVTDQISGWVVPPGQPDSLAACLSSVLAAPVARSEAAKAAQDFVSKRFTILAMIDRYEQLYRHLLAGHPISDLSEAWRQKF
jgi:glycosyltransferase involved in cell wall biosynthesis